MGNGGKQTEKEGIVLLVNSEKLSLELPAALVHEKSLRPADIALYLQIKLAPGRSLSDLKRITGYGRDAIRGQCKRLSNRGWIVVVSERNRKVVYPTTPHEYQIKVAERYRECLRFVSRVGQTHMCEWLRILMDVCWIPVNVRPWFLQNPKTGEYLEYDCFLPEPYNIAFEFHGQQHFRTTERFPSEEALGDLQARDHMKVGLSQRHGVELVIVTEQDLSYEGMLTKIPPGVPLKYVDREGPRVKSLESLCQEYAANVRRTMARQDRQSKQNQ